MFRHLKRLAEQKGFPQMHNNAECALKHSFTHQQRRCFYMWLNYVFNRKDESRLKEIGPDRAAAEWVIRNGGEVKFATSISWIKSYNGLPLGSGRSYRLTEINGSGASITDNGFDHLDGLEHLSHLDLNGCKFIANLSPFVHVKNSLVYLDLSNCKRVANISPLTELRNLKVLKLSNTLGKGRDEQIEKIMAALPECKVDS